MPKRATSAESASDVLRNEQVVRILRMLRDLDRVGGSDLYELAERYGTTTRTVRRDLDALRDAGIPLVTETGEGTRKRWRLDADAGGKLTSVIEVSHFLALRLALEESTVLRRNQSLFAVMEDLADRIEKALGRKGRDELRELDRCFFSWEKFAWRDAPREVMWPLIGAISKRRVCLVTYKAPSSGNAEKRFRVLPLRLIVHNGTLYVHAWHAHFKTVLLLNLQRLKQLSVLDESEAVPPEYDPEKLENTAFGIFIGKAMESYALKFDAFARPYIEERKWHPTETLEPQADGSLVLRFSCTPSYEVTNWVASWREHVEVLEPKALKDELRTYAQWLVGKYGGAA
ncbi:MAG: WYL domain-containing protein [Myxococcaceae bacterium]|nr:WYL domain-containing protein [Myxococcaceae bacterium]